MRTSEDGMGITRNLPSCNTQTIMLFQFIANLEIQMFLLAKIERKKETRREKKEYVDRKNLKMATINLDLNIIISFTFMKASKKNLLIILFSSL